MARNDRTEELARVRDQLMTPAEVAALFRVDVKTVTRWAQAGKLSAVRTLGGHRRYPREQVQALVDDNTTPQEVITTD